jgi:DNA-binding GntR family transcriptional regulator
LNCASIQFFVEYLESGRRDMTSKNSGQHRTKKELIVELLREIILSGELVPGERLLQEELAERFEVSPTPIREAIQQLIAEGVLIHSPYRGVQVAEVRLEDMHEVYLIRSVTEELATRSSVPNLRIADVKQLHTYQNQLRTALRADDLRQVRKLNQELHMLIYRTAEMPLLFQIIRNLWTKSPRDTLYVLPSRAAHAIGEHERILEAIDAGDAEQAGRHMRTHIESGYTALRDYLAPQGG